MIPQILIIEQHSSLNDSRIVRHITYCKSQKHSTYRIHLDRNTSYGIVQLIPDEIVPTCTVGHSICSYTFINSILYNLNSLSLNLIPLSKILSLLRIRLDFPTIIHVHDPIHLPLAVKISKRFSAARIVYDRHEIYEKKIKGFLGMSYPKMGRIGEILSSRKIDGVITVNQFWINSVKQLFLNSVVEAVPNYPDFSEYNDALILDKIHGATGGRLRFVYVGSLNWRYDRDIGLILKIADKLMPKYAHIEFHIGGYTNDNELLSEFSRMGEVYPNQFFYHGYMTHSEVIRLTEMSHIGFFLILPSTDYWVLATPNKIYEYLKCGVAPVIRANCADTEMLKSCSLIFNRDTSDEDIVRDIETLLLNPALVKEMMIKAHDLSDDFSFSEAAKKYGNVYREVYSRDY